MPRQWNYRLKHLFVRPPLCCCMWDGNPIRVVYKTAWLQIRAGDWDLTTTSCWSCGCRPVPEPRWMQLLHPPFQGHATDDFHRQRRPFRCRNIPLGRRSLGPLVLAFHLYACRCLERSGTHLCPIWRNAVLYMPFKCSTPHWFLTNSFDAKKKTGQSFG